MNWYKIAKKEFDLKSEIDNLWRNILIKEQENSNVEFNLENNNSVSDPKYIKLGKFKHSDSEKEFRVLSQMCEAGGGWECPIVYFKCQFEYRYNDKKLNINYSPTFKCIIIPINQPNLIKKDNKYFAKNNNMDCHNIENRKLWDEFKKLANKKVQEYINYNMMNKKELGFLRDLTDIKIAQTKEELLQQYSELGQGSINITGTGQSESIRLPNGSVINAGDLLRQALNRVQHILIQHGVREIDTSPLFSYPQAQGLAISHEVGKIYIDIQKIVNQVKQSLPPVAQLDGIEADPDISQDIVNQISNYLLAEIGETISHESKHVFDYQEAFMQGLPFTSVQEAPAEQFGKNIRNKYFNNGH